MKEKFKILGLIVAIIVVISTFLKLYHLPGAAFGLVITLGGMFPLYLIFNKASLTSLNLNIKNAFFAYSISIYALGFLFILLHWPSGNMIFGLGFVLSLISILLIYISKNIVLSRIFLIVIIVFVCIIYLASFRGVSKNVIDGFTLSNENNETLKKVLVELTNEIDTTKNNKEIDNKADELINYIEQIKQSIAIRANENEGVTNYENIRYKENFDISTEVMIIQGKAKELKIKIDEYKSFLLDFEKNEQSISKIYQLLNTQDPAPHDGILRTWESYTFEHYPVISVINTLTNLQVNIKIAELITNNK